MANTELREYAKRHHVFLWEIALKLGLSEPTIIRRLRTELSDEDHLKIKSCIDEIAAKKEKEI